VKILLYSSSGLITFKEKIEFIIEINVGRMLRYMLNFSPKIGLYMLIHVMLIKKSCMESVRLMHKN